jgi:hypothetical protein
MVSQRKSGGHMDMDIPPPGMEPGQLEKKFGVEREMHG